MENWTPEKNQIDFMAGYYRRPRQQPVYLPNRPAWQKDWPKKTAALWASLPGYGQPYQRTNSFMPRLAAPPPEPVLEEEMESPQPDRNMSRVDRAKAAGFEDTGGLLGWLWDSAGELALEPR